MRDRWSDTEARKAVERWAERVRIGGGPELDTDTARHLALRTYSSRLLGAEPALVLHGGGNTSVKGRARGAYGEEVETIFVKASGWDLAAIEPEGHLPLDLTAARRLARLTETGDRAADDARFTAELRRAAFDPGGPAASLEAPIHALLPARHVDHTHADAILALSNRPDGEAVVREALGEKVAVLPYVLPGLPLARAVAKWLAEQEGLAEGGDVPLGGIEGMVWLHHGLVTWGDTAEESYRRTLELVRRAERWLADEVSAAERAGRPAPAAGAAPLPSADERARRLHRLAPILRGRLQGSDAPEDRLVLRHLGDEAALRFLAAPGARDAALTPPLTTDHLIRTRPLPLWLEIPGLNVSWDGDDAALSEAVHAALESWREAYAAYLERHEMPAGLAPFPAVPRVVLVPGLGVLAAGRSAGEADIARDITAQTFAVKAALLAAGKTYRGLSEEHLFEMEYRPLQHAKLAGRRTSRYPAPLLPGTTVLVTGAAGAIGAGIAEVLLEAGAHVLLTDLGGEALDRLREELAPRHPGRVEATAMDVTDPASVAAGFRTATALWGGVDLVVSNAGLAHVATLTELATEDFQRLERVNVHGTLHVLAEAGRLFERQGTGGDIVLISTKNVFAPGASFGAYSATKAAAHQLARIAGQELAPLGVRVNMVAPDAVFGAGDRRSGLWKEVGPSRMKARGLAADELEDYYRGRNLLRARVTPRHVGDAVLQFARRLTPTTGATLPVDGGLPDATPR